MHRRLRPLARATQSALHREREGEALSSAAIAELMAVAEVLSEGGLADGDRRWFGSTMVTFDLRRLSRLRAALEAPEQLRYLAEGSVRLRLWAHRLATSELLRRVPDRAVGTITVETRFRLEGPLLHLDVDVEAPVALSSATELF